MTSPRASIASILFALTVPALIFAQAPPINFQSTEIQSDHTITFRFIDPGATKVLLNIRDLPKPMAMEKDASGAWTVTTQPLQPAIYNYYFDADGQWRLDPANPHVAIKFQNVTNLLDVRSDIPQPGSRPTCPTANCTTTSTPHM
jgi:hypothetical protein